MREAVSFRTVPRASMPRVCRLTELVKFLDRFLKKRCHTVSEIILHDAVSGWSANVRVVYRPFFRCRALLNCAYSVTSSRFSSSRSAVALRRPFVRALGAAWGKKTVIGTPKNLASLSKSEIEGLQVSDSQRETVLAVGLTASADPPSLCPRPFAALP